MVENPPSDARDPDEWESFFSQFGKVAYVTVAKSDGDLVWKCLEPRQLMLMLYRDNPNELRDKIKVVSERVQKKPKRSSRFCYSRVETPDVEKTEEAFGDHHKVNVAHEQLDAGDEDADGGPNESMAYFHIETCVSTLSWHAVQTRPRHASRTALSRMPLGPQGRAGCTCCWQAIRRSTDFCHL